jgi:hypothetical protein
LECGDPLGPRRPARMTSKESSCESMRAGRPRPQGVAHSIHEQSPPTISNLPSPLSKQIQKSAGFTSARAVNQPVASYRPDRAG